MIQNSFIKKVFLGLVSFGLFAGVASATTVIDRTAEIFETDVVASHIEAQSPVWTPCSEYGRLCRCWRDIIDCRFAKPIPKTAEPQVESMTDETAKTIANSLRESDDITTPQMCMLNCRPSMFTNCLMCVNDTGKYCFACRKLDPPKL